MLLYLSGSGIAGSIVASQGKIEFRTCFKSVFLPLSYVLTLASAAYLAPGGSQGCLGTLWIIG